jgi:hypothetical protein
MEFNNLDDIIADLKANYTGPSQNYQESGDKPPKKVLGQPMGMGVSSSLSAPTKTAEGTQIFRPVDYSVSPNAIYDRLRDGSYVAKFENYLGETGNENRLAREQSATEQWMNGLGKFTTKTLNYALDSTVGTVWGIFEGMASGEFRDVWDNDFSNWMDDTNKKLDYALPNYYTDEQKSQGVLSSMLTTNFWANDFLGGLAFVTGALLPEAAIALASGGASVPVSLAKGAFRGAAALGKATAKSGLKKAGKETIENLGKQGLKKIDNVSKYNRVEEAANSVKNLQSAIYAKKAGDVLNTGRFLVQSSNFEAGMEARHNFHDAIDSYIENYKESNGGDPSPEDLSQFIADATKSANYVYTANMAILSVSNAAMFGKTFGIAPGLSKRINNAGNRLIGLGMKRGADGTMALQKANRLQKVAGNTYKVLSKPAVEGLYEEGLQGVAGSSMQNYLDAKYNPDSENALSVWSSFTDALNHQYTSNEGWKEMAIGMLIGFGAPMIQGQAPSGIMSDSYRSKRKSLESQVELSNKQRANIITRVNDATAISNFSAKMKSKADNMEDVSVDNSLVNAQYIKASEHMRSQGQTLKDYDTIVDNMELTEDQITEIGQENVDAYKQSLKDGFRKDLENYNFAKKATEALGLDRTLKDTPANIAEMGDAVMMNIMMGKSALDRARTVASQIDSMIGTEGVFNHLEHYSNLSQEQKDKIELLKKKKRQLNTALKQADKYGKELAGISTGMKRDFTDETKQKRFDKASEKRVEVQQEINTLNQEIEDLSEQVNNDLAKQNFDLSQTVQTDANTHDVQAMVEELDKLEDYAKSLQKAGKTESYETLMSMVEEFKTQSDAHREMNNMVRKMYDTNFFTTKEGRGLRKMITGKKYELSEEFRQIIRDNDKIIDASLELAGFRNTGKTAEQHIEEAMGDNNETLSDREKYRLESIIRVQLGYNKLQKKLEKIVKDQEIADPEPITDKNTPLKGDTVALTQKLEPEGKDLGSVEVLTELINSITRELDQFRLGRVDQKRIDQLEQKLEELTQQKQRLEEEAKSIEAEPETTTEEKEDTKTEEGTEEREKVDSDPPVDTSELGKLNAEIASTKEALEQAKNTITVRIVQTEDYKRVEELNKKKVKEGLTEEEQSELENLEDDIDQWITINGIVAEGLRLSDLIKQRAVLNNAQVTELQTVQTITAQDVLDSPDIKDKTSNIYGNLGQTYHAVTATMTKMEDGTPAVEISGVNAESLIEEVGFPFDYETNAQNNVLITQETQRQINETSPISILPTNKNLDTNYSIVLKTVTDSNGNQEVMPLLSQFKTGFNEEQIPEEIYNMSMNEDISLEIDPQDPYNKELLGRYNRARSEAGRERALNDLRNGLVLKVKDSKGNFVAVLKAKRTKGNIDSNYRVLAALRNKVVANEEVLLDLVEDRVVSHDKLDLGDIKVKNILPGHPNFNFSKDEDGQISIDSKSLTEQDIEKIDDIGYMQNGEIKVRKKGREIDTRFLSKVQKDKSGTKFPFAVFSVGSRLIAYPLSITPGKVSQEDMQEFERIFKSRTNMVDKASALNVFMAERGVDIKKSGNAFVAVGKDNMNDEFFSKKVAQLESIEYFRNLDEEWLNSKTPLTEVLGAGVSIDIKTSDPFHSPKLELDFSKLDVEVTIEEESKPKADVSKTVGKGASKIADHIKNSKKKDC